MNGLSGKNILVTGGCGTIGQALVKQLMGHKPKVIRIFDNDEAGLFNTQQIFSGDNLRFFLGDMRNYDRLDMAMEDIDIVFHCAALKHVGVCEYSPFEAVKTNVLGAQNMIKAALNNNVDKVVYTSSDKAVNPTNVMGTTKLLGEQLVIAANNYSGKKKTKFSCVRFGNVLGSSGSIIPLWKDQIRGQRKMTITDERMTRFIMSEAGATSLVLKASDIMLGGETFILKMPSARIIDIAKTVIADMSEKLGIDPGSVDIQNIGIKPGEKLYEELMTENEIIRSYDADDLYIVLPEANLSGISYSKYEAMSKIGSPNYNSKDVELLDQSQIKDILSRASLLEV